MLNYFLIYSGLWHDDMLYESEDVKEALRRLPTKILDERNFRIVRALQLSCQKIVLPQEQWTKYEEVIIINNQPSKIIIVQNNLKR